jgi:hypothetical protein
MLQHRCASRLTPPRPRIRLPLCTQETRLAAAGWRGLQLDLRRGLAPQRSWERQLHSAATAIAQLLPPGDAEEDALPLRRLSAATMRDAVDATELAWASLLGRELPMEGLTRQMLTLVGSSQSFTRRLAEDTAANQGASPTLTAWTVRNCTRSRSPSLAGGSTTRHPHRSPAASG